VDVWISGYGNVQSTLRPSDGQSTSQQPQQGVPLPACPRLSTVSRTGLSVTPAAWESHTCQSRDRPMWCKNSPSVPQMYNALQLTGIRVSPDSSVATRPFAAKRCAAYQDKLGSAYVGMVASCGGRRRSDRFWCSSQVIGTALLES